VSVSTEKLGEAFSNSKAHDFEKEGQINLEIILRDMNYREVWWTNPQKFAKY